MTQLMLMSRERRNFWLGNAIDNLAVALQLLSRPVYVGAYREELAAGDLSDDVREEIELELAVELELAECHARMAFTLLAKVDFAAEMAIYGLDNNGREHWNG